jgi:hypothetical protein
MSSGPVPPVEAAPRVGATVRSQRREAMDLIEDGPEIDAATQKHWAMVLGVELVRARKKNPKLIDLWREMMRRLWPRRRHQTQADDDEAIALAEEILPVQPSDEREPEHQQHSRSDQFHPSAHERSG